MLIVESLPSGHREHLYQSRAGPFKEEGGRVEINTLTNGFNELKDYNCCEI